MKWETQIKFKVQCTKINGIKFLSDNFYILFSMVNCLFILWTLKYISFSMKTEYIKKKQYKLIGNN